MYKNTFELDPAQQAYQSANIKDSSRARWASTADVWIVDLSSPTISFPHSKEQYSVSNFAPKASYLNKNVCTDKSKLDVTKPNIVTCSLVQTCIRIEHLTGSLQDTMMSISGLDRKDRQIGHIDSNLIRGRKRY